MNEADNTDRTAEQVRDGPATSLEEWAELRRSLDGLSHLAGHAGLKGTLTSVAEFAVGAIPGAEGAGLTLLDHDRPDTIVATAEFVSAVDDIQYRLGEGPCISAAEDGVTVQSPELGSDSRWPAFSRQVALLGVHSALSLPLITSHGVVGAMNIYAQHPSAFSQSSETLGELFAVPAAISVHNAQILAESQRLATQLRHSLSARSSIDQAIGILISRRGITADEALVTLKILSTTQRQKLHVVAQSMIDSALRRARARLTR